MLPFRGEENSWRHLKVMGDLGQISARRFDIRNEDSIARAVEHSNVVINLMGREWSTRNFTMDQVHHRAAEVIARKSREAGVARLIHVGVLGSDDCSPSEFLRSKALGEQAVLKNFPNATVLRPAPVFGAEDRVVVSRAYMCRNLYMVPVLNPTARLQPLFVSDLATAIMHCAEDPTTIGQTLDLAGPHTYTHAELTDLVAKILNINIIKLPLTGSAATLVAKLANMQINPFFTPDHVHSTAIDATIDHPEDNAITRLGVEKPSSVEEVCVCVGWVYV
jgi:NADH dehydrogenase (ubiquinone) 1 alpha subcomplex subunit 9